MNAPLQPELIELETRYNELVDAVQSQAMDIKDAMRTLENLRVIDGDGTLWGMDADGNFVSGMPGEPLQITDPIRFRQQQLPMRPETTSGWGTPDFQTPPQIKAAPAAEEESTQIFKFDNYTKPAAVAKAKPKKIKTQKTQGSLLAKIPTGAITSWISSNKRTLLVVLIAIVAIVAIVLTQGGKGEDKPSGVPTSALSNMPVDPNGTAKPATSNPSNAAPAVNTTLPTGDQVTTLVSALTSGKRDLTKAALQDPGDDKTVAVNTARYASYSETYQLAFNIGPVAGESGGAIADVTVTDKVSKTVVLTGKIEFIEQDGHWYIKAWPALT